MAEFEHQLDHIGVKLSRSEEKFKMLFEFSPIGMAMINHNTGEFIEVNNTLLQMTGYSKKEFLELSFWDITPHEYEKQEQQQMKDLESKGSFGPNDKEYIRKDGSRFPIRIKGFILEDVDGSKLVWGLIEDISNQFKRIFDDLQDAYIQIDLSNNIKLVNKKATKLFGYITIDEMIGQNFEKLFFDMSDFNHVLHEIGKFSKLTDYNFRVTRKDGSWFWGSLNIQQVKDNSTKSILTECVIRDISDRKLLESNLEKSEELFRGIIHSMEDVVYTLDTEMRHTGVYGNWIEKTNLSKDFFLGKTATEIFGDLYGQIHEVPTRKALSGESVVYEWENKSDNSTQYFQTSLSPIFDSKGFVTGVVGVGRDITSIKHKEFDLSSALNKNKRILDNLQDAYFQSDKNRNFVFINSRAANMFGYQSIDELLGRDGTILWANLSDRDKAIEILAENGHISDFVCEGVRKDGSKLWVSMNIQYVKDEHGEILGSENVVRDITERINLEQQIGLMNEEIIKQKEMFRLLVKNIDETIGITDENGKIKFRSSNNENVFGISAEQVIGTNAFDYVHPNDKQRLYENFVGLIQDGPGAQRSGEYRYFHQDGSTIMMEMTAKNMLDNKIIDGLILTYKDITDRKAREREKIAESGKIRALIESTDDLIWVVDSNNFGLIVFNPAFASFFDKGLGVKVKDGMCPEEMLPVELVTYWYSMYDEALTKGPYKRIYELSTTAKTLELSFNLVKIEGEIIGISVMSRDITELKKSEKELETRIKGLKCLQDIALILQNETDLNCAIQDITDCIPSAFTFPNKVCVQIIFNDKQYITKNFKVTDLILSKLINVTSKNSGSLVVYYLGDIDSINDNPFLLEEETLIGIVAETLAKYMQRETAVKGLQILVKQAVNTISKIGELRDVYTAGHQRRVRDLSCEIAQILGMSDEEIMNLDYGATIHDIGKIYIPTDILTKPGTISNLEYQIIQTHAEQGYNVVKGMDFNEKIPLMIYQHHERLDGSGYPLGISGDEIIIESRIIAVADVVEAMASHRPYRPALGVDAALEEITAHKGTKYDALVVEACVKLFKEKKFEFKHFW